MSLSLIQYHFRNQDEFGREVIRTWAEEVSRSLLDAVEDARGLARTLKLCRRWVALAATDPIPFEAIRLEARRDGHDGVRGLFLRVLEVWMDETHRSLQQARLMKELKADVDLRAIAIELHRLVWSQGWTSALYGADASAHGVLRSIWNRLRDIAADPDRVLPPLESILGSDDHLEPEPDLEAHYGGAIPTWRIVLTPDDPLFQAFLRHETMGDLPEDVDAARKENKPQRPSG